MISGVFFLIEDVFRIGEYIESGATTKGTVEHISFRTVALRHHNGPLTFVPYGLLGTVRNDSRDWVIDKFNIPLPLSVDSEKIRKMIKGIGEDLALDPELGPLIREPLKGKLYRVDPGIKIFPLQIYDGPGLPVRRPHGGAQRHRSRSRGSGDLLCGRRPADHLDQTGA